MYVYIYIWKVHLDWPAPATLRLKGHQDFSSPITVSAIASWITRWGYPNFIRLHCFIIIIPMPTPICMSWIHNLELTMAKACFAECRPFWLGFYVPAIVSQGIITLKLIFKCYANTLVDVKNREGERGNLWTCCTQCFKKGENPRLPQRLDRANGRVVTEYSLGC